MLIFTQSIPNKFSWEDDNEKKTSSIMSKITIIVIRTIDKLDSTPSVFLFHFPMSKTDSHIWQKINYVYSICHCQLILILQFRILIITFIVNRILQIFWSFIISDIVSTRNIHHSAKYNYNLFIMRFFKVRLKKNNQ
jgi:hypothetical protein